MKRTVRKTTVRKTRRDGIRQRYHVVKRYRVPAWEPKLKYNDYVDEEGIGDYIPRDYVPRKRSAHANLYYPAYSYFPTDKRGGEYGTLVVTKEPYRTRRASNTRYKEQPKKVSMDYLYFLEDKGIRHVSMKKKRRC